MRAFYTEDFKGSDEEAVIAVSMHCVRSFFTRGLGRVLLEKGLDVYTKQGVVCNIEIIIDTAFLIESMAGRTSNKHDSYCTDLMAFSKTGTESEGHVEQKRDMSTLS